MFLKQRVLGIVAAALVQAGAAHAAAWVWDFDTDGIDDRIQEVGALGYSHAFTNLDPIHGQLRFQVSQIAVITTFGAYVRFDHHPTASDVTAVGATGAQVVNTYRNFDCLRVLATFLQVQSIRAISGVTRIESIQALYPVLQTSARSLRARDSEDDLLFPSALKDLGLDGTGVVIAFLDSGINDAPDSLNPGYPGHESLTGRCMGGGDFSSGLASLNRPDVNPQDHGTPAHGTHVAGIALGTGGPSHTFQGIAPGSRFVDCKVLGAGGVGFGVLDAVDWVISKRDTFWLGPGVPSYRGIQVLNISLSGLDSSDGQDLDAQALNIAAAHGMVPVASMGNDGRLRYVPSPASADSAIAVGAVRDRSTVRRDDDIVDTDYSNQGPRVDDGDGDHSDELKPLVAAPGSDITSADGNPATDGTRYVSMSGTSMAAPHVSGIVALLLQAHPGMSATRIMQILRFTSEHKGVPDDPFYGGGHPDPSWNQAWGYGEPDAYAAGLEALDPGSTQLVQLRGLPHFSTRSILVRWLAQREIGTSGYRLYRSPDSSGAYVRLNSSLIPAVGVPAPASDSLHAWAVNRTAYTWVDTGLTPGAAYYYKVASVDGAGAERFTPVLRVTLATQALAAVVRVAYTHNYADQDLTVRFGSGHDPSAPDWVRTLGGTSDADSMIVRPGVSLTGTQEWIFHTELPPTPALAAVLPPGPAHPWFLGVTEGGYLNASGSVDAFSLAVMDDPAPGVDSTFVSLSLPQHTVEGQTWYMWIPLPVATMVSAPQLRGALEPVLPNPCGGRAVTYFSIPRSGPVRITLHDVSGREVARLFESSGLRPGRYPLTLSWTSSRGTPLASGIYWMRMHSNVGDISRRVALVR